MTELRFIAVNPGIALPISYPPLLALETCVDDLALQMPTSPSALICAICVLFLLSLSPGGYRLASSRTESSGSPHRGQAVTTLPVGFQVFHQSLKLRVGWWTFHIVQRFCPCQLQQFTVSNEIGSTQRG